MIAGNMRVTQIFQTASSMTLNARCGCLCCNIFNIHGTGMFQHAYSEHEVILD